MPKPKNTKKSKKTSQPNYLKITALSVLGLAIITSLYVYWDPSSPLNMISTTASSLVWGSLFAIFALFGTVFWILMLIDSLQKNKIIWFIFILLGPGIIGFIYFLIEGPDIIRRYFKQLAWLAIILFAVSWAVFFFPNLDNRLHPFDASKLKPTGRQFVAEVTTKDLKDYEYIGQTVCRETTENGKYYVELEGGSVKIPKNTTKFLNYKLSMNAADGNSSELGSGGQSFDGQPESGQDISVPDLIGGPTPIGQELENCHLSLWSTN